MKELFFGPSGVGKTYLSSELQKMGLNAVDADMIQGLSSWFDGDGNKVAYPENADEEFLSSHSFLWDREFLQNYLAQNPDVYLFGASGNVMDMVDLFDRVYFLKVPPEVQRERLMHESRANPMGKTEFQRENAVAWGNNLEEQAKKRGITLLDATLPPSAILELLKTK